VYTHKDSGTAASVTQLRLHWTPYQKIYMIDQSFCWSSRLCWRHTCFVPSPTVAERRALLSLRLHFMAQYKFFVIIIIINVSSLFICKNVSLICLMKATNILLNLKLCHCNLVFWLNHVCCRLYCSMWIHDRHYFTADYNRIHSLMITYFNIWCCLSIVILGKWSVLNCFRISTIFRWQNYLIL